MLLRKCAWQRSVARKAGAPLVTQYGEGSLVVVVVVVVVVVLLVLLVVGRV